MNKSKLFSMLVGVVVLSAGFSASALAASTAYPGSMCHGYRTSDEANLRHGYNGEIMNNGTGGSTLDCPLVRSSYPYSGVTMYVKDLSTKGDVTCQIMTRSALGSLGSWTNRSSTGTDTAWYGQWLDFGAETYSYTGYSYFRCYFPATANSSEYVQITDYYITAP